MAVGLDPFDDTEDHITPAGLGNVVGKRITQWMNDNDGLQRAKDFVDIEGLDRIAQYHTAQDWYHWKPTYAGSNRFQGIRNGIVTQQTFVSPSLGIKSFIYENEADFIALNLQSTVPVLNTTEESYIVKAQQFLDIQESIGDYEKAVAELSNNKISGSVFLILAYVPLLQNLTAPEEYPMMYDEFSMVTSGCAEYAATHAAWRHKRTYLAGRPRTIIRHLAATNAEFAATYPAAANFEPMIPAGDHPEYPSGSSTIYSAFAQAADNWFYDNFGIEEASKKTGKLTFTVPASKFYWQDGPSQDVTLEYEHLNAWIEELPLSRVYGGVHFLDSGVAGLNLGKEVGHSCSRLLKRLKEGDMNATYTYANREAINPFNL